VIHRPIYSGYGRLYWVSCTCGWMSGKFHRSPDADRAFALHASRQVSVSNDPALLALLRQVASK
jgi:hypothetical protein